MKTKAQPATVQELDQNDHPVLHSTQSAKTRIAKATNSDSTLSQRKRTPYAFRYERKTPTTAIYGECSISMPIDGMAKLYQTYKKGVPMTIYTRSQDRSRDRNEVPGCKFRKIFGTGRYQYLDARQVTVRT